MSPPRLSRALLARILPEDMRDSTLADLEEMYSRRVERGGVPGARRWYRLQVVSFALRFGWERIRAAGARAPAPLFSTLDWKLGFRMLVKHPGLSLIGGLALATVIGFGAGFAHVGRQVLLPDLGFEDGDRIVRLDRYDLAQRVSGPVTVEELRIWREELTMIEQLGAYRPMERTLVGAVGEDGVTTRAPLVAAKITASAFRLTGVEAFRGRVLSEADERPGAPPVVVLGHDVWQDRFDGQPEVLGRELQLGRERYTVVGVMPEGFGFPESHDAWVPLRLDELGPNDQRVVRAFGKLAPGATLAAAQAELTAIGGRTTAELDRRNGLPVTASTGDSVVALLQPRVLGFAAPDPAGDDLMGALLTSFLILTCLGAVAANVATLVFARTALREAELVVRGALGASRGHIAGQLFVEALVLAGVAAVVGVLGAQAVVEYVMNMPLTRQQPALQLGYRNRHVLNLTRTSDLDKT